MQGDSSTERQEEFVPLSKDEFRKIMGTEKYQTDPEYQKKIDAQRLKTKRQDTATFLPGQYFAQRNGKRYTL